MLMLEITKLHVAHEGIEILKGIDLEVRDGEMHVVMGPNASGKSTLTKAIMGHPHYKVTHGDIRFDGSSILGMGPESRARAGIFLQFQNPVEIEGVGYMSFLHAAKEALSAQQQQTSMKAFISEVRETAARLKLDNGFIGRQLNYGFSGGEKKKAEILQLGVLKPRLAILDEPDSGLDIDAVRLVASYISEMAQARTTSFIIITHYNRILSYIKPDKVHVLACGRIMASGGSELVERLEREGYDAYVGKGAGSNGR